MLGERLRVSEKIKERLIQAAPLLFVAVGTAAIAAPAINKVGLGSAHANVAAAVQQVGQFGDFQPAPVERLVWEGADVDGDGEADFANPTGQETRGVDAYGHGEFGASRDGGSRRHEGVDFIADAGQKVVAPISGYVTKIGYAYAGDSNLKFVEISNPALKYEARVFYVDPSVQVGDSVAVGKPIGRQHTLQRKYRGGMTDHVHLEIVDRRGRRIDAANVIQARYETVLNNRG